MKGRFCLMVALAVAGASALAAKHPRTSVLKAAPSLEAFGFTLGQVPTLLTCPTTKEGLFDSRSWSADLDATCLESASGDKAAADGRSKISAVHFNHSDKVRMLSHSPAGGLALQQLDGKLQGIYGRTTGADGQSRIYAVLRKKYGTPATLTRKRHAGTRVEGISATWKFSNLRVDFESTGAATGEGSFSILTSAAFDYTNVASPKPSAQFRE